MEAIADGAANPNSRFQIPEEKKRNQESGRSFHSAPHENLLVAAQACFCLSLPVQCRYLQLCLRPPPAARSSTMATPGSADS